jgi:small-conductance mechanosensitive channel
MKSQEIRSKQADVLLLFGGVLIIMGLILAVSGSFLPRNIGGILVFLGLMLLSLVPGLRQMSGVH